MPPCRPMVTDQRIGAECFSARSSPSNPSTCSKAFSRVFWSASLVIIQGLIVKIPFSHFLMIEIDDVARVAPSTTCAKVAFPGKFVVLRRTRKRVPAGRPKPRYDAQNQGLTSPIAFTRFYPSGGRRELIREPACKDGRLSDMGVLCCSVGSV